MTPEEITEAIETLRKIWKNAQYEEAKNYAFELLERKEILDDLKSYTTIINILGDVYRNLNDVPKAFEYLEKALKINEEIGNKLGKAHNIGNIGLIYSHLFDFEKAIEHFQYSILLHEEIGNLQGVCIYLTNLGTVYNSISDFSKAIECFERALKIDEKMENKATYGGNLVNIGKIYFELKEYEKALEYYRKALVILEEINHRTFLATVIMNIGGVYSSTSNFSTAIEYFEKALEISLDLNDKKLISLCFTQIGVVYSELFDFNKAMESFQKALSMNEEIGDKENILVTKANIAIVLKNQGNYDQAIEYLQQLYSISEEISLKYYTKEILKQLTDIYEKIGNLEYAYKYFKQFYDLKEEIESKEAKTTAENFYHIRKSAEREKQIAFEQGRLIERENILRNILPDSVTDRLVKGENPIADYFETASVLFMDIVGFTSLASIAPAKQLVYLLDTIFQKADEVVETFGLEKIKTIGDGYLAVANVTAPLDEHQKATAQAALQLLETMRDFTVNIPNDLGNTDWINNMKDLEIRIGIHTGEVVAGIIGKNKYTYDLWGDAVNVASRMESNSEPGCIHISEEFAKSIEQYPEFKLIPRGEISIKGKGIMNTFWLEKGR